MCQEIRCVTAVTQTPGFDILLSKRYTVYKSILCGGPKNGDLPKERMATGLLTERQTLVQIADLFKAFGDPTRVQILSLLLDQELCVSEITEGVALTQSAVSHQLRILKQMHLIKYRRDGKNILYSLADDHVRTILQMGLEHVLE